MSMKGAAASKKEPLTSQPTSKVDPPKSSVPAQGAPQVDMDDTYSIDEDEMEV